MFVKMTTGVLRSLFLSLNIVKGLGDPDRVRVAQAGVDLNTVLGVYDQILAKRKYLAGNDLSLVDLFHLPNGAALTIFGYAEMFKRYPNVDRWFAAS